MQTITLKYDERNTLIKSILESAVLAGATLVEPKKQVDTLKVKEDALKAYQKMFGKRKDNKYTDNEIFIFNSKLRASKSFAKYV